MSNGVIAKENLDQQLASNTARMEEMLQGQYNVEVTRSLVLCFSSPEEDCAKALNKALFAKGTRVLQQDPESKEDGRFHIRVGVKRSIRDAVREEFVADMVQTAAGMNGSFDGWNLLTEDTPEATQKHEAAPDGKDPAVGDPLQGNQA